MQNMKKNSIWFCFCCAILVTTSIFHVKCQTLDEKNQKNSSSDTKTVIINTVESQSGIRKVWDLSDKGLKTAMGKFVRRAMPSVMRQVYSRNMSQNCLTGLLNFATGLRKIRLWAFKMLDASGKLPEGLLAGTLTMLGNYKECVDIAVNESKVQMKGQYCSVNIVPPLPEWRPLMSLYQRVPELENVSTSGSVIDFLTGFIHNLHVVHIKLGLCMPSLCSPDDINKLVQIIPEQTGLNWKFNVHSCETKEETTFTVVQMSILYIFGILAILLLSGTLVGFIWSDNNGKEKRKQGLALQILRSFSVPCNVRKLAEYGSPVDKTRFVHGLTIIALLWIFFCNIFLYINYDVASNFVEALSFAKMMFYEILLNRSFALQTLFFLSGFISAYRVIKSEKGISVWKYILGRYIRYTPAYIFAIALVMLTPIWGSGPSWNDHMWPIYNKCRDTWWANILYINNLIDSDSVCLDHTWVFSIDAQLHLLGLLVLIPMKRKPKIGLAVNFVFIAASILTIALTNVYYDLPPNEMLAFLQSRDQQFFAGHTFYRLYTHACTYCAGIAVGYLIAVKPDIKFSKITRCVLSMATGACALATMCSSQEWNTGLLPSPLTAALYAAFGKAAWAAFLSWLAISCCTGEWSTVNSLLSWRPFAFTARLTFLAYILHPVLLQVVMATKKSHMFVEQFEVLYSAVSHVAPALVLAAVCFLSFEAPFLSLTEVICNRFRRRSLENADFDGEVICNNVKSEKPDTNRHNTDNLSNLTKATLDSTKF